MSARSTAWAHAQRVGNAGRKLVLLAIADACNDEGFGFPSINRIAWMAECSERTAQRAIRDLEGMKLLQVDRDRLREGGSQTSNGYQLLIANRQLALEGGVKLSPRQIAAPTAVSPHMNLLPSEEVFVSKGKKKTALKPLPTDFAISERVRTWAAEKKFDQLEAHLEAFISTCKAKGYQYVDWDEAFMGAVRKDWAGLRKGAAARNGDWAASEAGIEAKGRELGLTRREREGITLYRDRIKARLEQRT